MRRLTLTAVLLVAVHVSATRLRGPLDDSRPATALARRSGPAVAVINGVGFHTEVYCALLWSLVQASVNVSAHVLTSTTSGIEEVISGWYDVPFQEYDNFLPSACEYRAVVFATFPDQHGQIAEQLANKCPGQKLVFVVHNSQELLRNDYMHLLGLLKDADTQFLSLAPHTAVGLEAALRELGWEAPRVDVFVPVFPIETGLPPDALRQGFVLQGNLQGHRRNYSAVFESILESPELMQTPGVVLTLIGYGDLAIPAILEDKVAKRVSLSYKEYYRAIQGALAVLPAFASPVYLTRKASSSVAAAVICGTPLLADAALLQAYSYLPPRAVFETTADERLAVAVSRIAAHSSESQVKARVTAKLRAKLYADNLYVLAKFLDLSGASRD